MRVTLRWAMCFKILQDSGTVLRLQLGVNCVGTSSRGARVQHPRCQDARHNDLSEEYRATAFAGIHSSKVHLRCMSDQARQAKGAGQHAAEVQILCCMQGLAQLHPHSRCNGSQHICMTQTSLQLRLVAPNAMQNSNSGWARQQLRMHSLCRRTTGSSICGGSGSRRRC